MIRLVDDQLLSQHLRGIAPDEAGSLQTTGCFYVRLCQAVLGPATRIGRLSTPFAQLPELERQRAIGSVLELPPEIGLISFRDLGPLVAQVRQRHQLNLLSAEVVAAALYLTDVVVQLSTPAPRLEAALAAEGIAVEGDGRSR